MTDHESLMKRCQRGATNLNDANNLLAECYWVIGALISEKERAERNRDMWRGQVESQAEDIAKLRQEIRVTDVLAEALAEIKATSDGESTQPIADIIAGCIAEIGAMSKEG